MSEATSTGTQSARTLLFFKPTRKTIILLLAFFLLCGIGVRMIDFTDLPLDFAATRQLRSLIIARGLYYQMDTPNTTTMPQDIRHFGINAGNNESIIEPPIMEYMTAYVYRIMDHENILVSRTLAILFWVAGGIPIFLLARKIMDLNGSFAALAAYLFTPFGVFASRSFQPEALMILCILWALYFQITWAQEENLKNAILAGLFTGLAVFVKAPAAFFVGFPFAWLVLSKGVKSLKQPTIFLMAALALLPAILFNAVSATVGGNAGAIFGTRFFPELFTDIDWYSRWLRMIRSVVGYFPFIIGLLAFCLIKKRQDRGFYISMWLAYLLYGFVFAYHIYTHNYYHLPLVPIIALAIGYLFSLFFSKLEAINTARLPRAAILFVSFFSLLLCAQVTRGTLIQSEYRHEAQYWASLGEKIGHNASVIALTHDNGYRLSYWGIVSPQQWPTAGDRTIKSLVGASDPDFIQLFKELTLGKQYFLVTLMGEFDSQPDLKEYLYSHYPYEQGDGFILFDLIHPLNL